MEIIIDRLSPNLVFELIHSSSELNPTKVRTLEDTYLLQTYISKHSTDITDSMLTLHNLCESSEFASNIFCMFESYTTVATHSCLRFMYGIKIATFMAGNKIRVSSGGKQKTLNASDPDTFGAMQAYLR